MTNILQTCQDHKRQGETTERDKLEKPKRMGKLNIMWDPGLNHGIEKGQQ